MTKNTDKPIVYIVGPTFGITPIFTEYGYRPITDAGIHQLDKDPDFVCWMGGTDISPSIYKQEAHPLTQRSNKERDEREIQIWNKYRHVKKLGICRGAQLLNALNGGSMIQHVSDHIGGNHKVLDYKNRETTVCSVHHQMMIPAPSSKMIAWSKNISMYRTSIDPASGETWEERGRTKTKEPEVLFIPEDKALCFQAHPEFGPKSCTDYFFSLIKELY